MIALNIILGVLLGMALGIYSTMKLIVLAINRADICYEEREFVKGVLGIKP